MHEKELQMVKILWYFFSYQFQLRRGVEYYNLTKFGQDWTENKKKLL